MINLTQKKSFTQILFIIVISLLSVYSCESGGNDNGNNGNGSGVAFANTVVSDANGEIGKAVSVDSQKILLITSTGHLVCLRWDGAIMFDQNIQSSAPSGMYFSGSGCTGTPILLPGALNLYPKFVWIGRNRMFIAKTFGEDGRPYYDSSIQRTVKSVMGYTEISNASGWVTGIECIEVTKTDIGLPETIALPLTIQFK